MRGAIRFFSLALRCPLKLNHVRIVSVTICVYVTIGLVRARDIIIIIIIILLMISRLIHPCAMCQKMT